MPCVYVLYFISVPAYFVTKSKQISVAKGKQVHVQCNVQGDNPINIKWKIQNTQQHLDETLDARYVHMYVKPSAACTRFKGGCRCG